MVTDYSSHQIKRTMVGKQGLGHPCPPSLGLEATAGLWILEPFPAPMVRFLEIQMAAIDFKLEPLSPQGSCSRQDIS